MVFNCRYMQAAEAYAAKSRASRSSTGSSQNGTWSGSKNTWSGSMNGGRGRSRPQLTSDTFRPPSRSSGSRPASRTTSASPGPWRRRQPSGGSGFEDDSLMTTVPSSTHSTPCKKPVKSAQTKGKNFWATQGHEKSFILSIFIRRIRSETKMFVLDQWGKIVILSFYLVTQPLVNSG